MLAAAAEDCEVRDDWFVAQDVNAWTSAAYAVVGVVIGALVVRRRLPPAFAALAAVTALEGLGSWLYHGDSGDVAQFLHDVPLVAALAFVAGWHVGRIFDASERGAVAGLVVGAAAGAAVWAAAPGATSVVVGIVVAATVVAEIVARRRGAPAVWTVPLLVLVGVAGAVWFTGSTDSPLCDEQSWLQPHGAWHVLTALLVLAWVDRAGATRAHPPRVWRRATDRTIGFVARGLAYAFYRSVDVDGRERFAPGRPMLVVANHGNGFVDPIVVTSVLGRLPRFLAKAALWKVVVARPFLALAGVLPVYRAADGDRSSDNQSIFEACHRELASGAAVAIFPEGTTGDRAGLDRVRSGAARIALGAVERAPDLVIVPIGLAFENRVETRSRAVVMVGEPIDVASWARHPSTGADPDPDDVRALTEHIRQALEDVSPEFASVDERDLLRAAASTACNERAGEATFGRVEVLARRLGAAPPEQRTAISEAFGDYATRLQLIGLTDRELRPARTSFWRLVLTAIALVVFGSLVVTATLIHLPAILLIVVATGAVRSTATKGTVRMLVGLTAGLATWIITGVLLADGWAAVAAAAIIAFEGWIALAALTPLTRLASTTWGWLRARDRAGLLPPVLAARAALVSAVDAAERSARRG